MTASTASWLLSVPVEELASDVDEDLQCPVAVGARRRRLHLQLDGDAEVRAVRISLDYLLCARVPVRQPQGGHPAERHTGESGSVPHAESLLSLSRLCFWLVPVDSPIRRPETVLQ